MIITTMRMGELLKRSKPSPTVLTSLARKQLRARLKTNSKWLPDITISREPGSGGKLIAKRLAKKLNFDLYDKRLISKICREMGVSEELLNNIDERPRNWISDTIHAAINPNYISDYEYVNILKKVMLRICRVGDAVILGRGGNFIVPTSKALHVRITAPLSFRIEKTHIHEKLTYKKARLRVIEVSRKREAFVKQYFGASGTNVLNYDLVINTKDITLDQAVSTIAHAFRQKFKKTQISK